MSPVLIFKCSICRKLTGPLGESDELPKNPSYDTSPADRERLLEYLMEKKDMWRYFQDWTYDVWEEDVDLVERGTSWNTEADRAAWLHKPLDGVPRWVSLLSDWLGMESTVERFGWTPCDGFPECMQGERDVCKYPDMRCEGNGKTRGQYAPWARFVQDEKEAK
jgi:hypothetical protein